MFFLSQSVGINANIIKKNCDYIVSLSPVYLVPPNDDGSGDTEMVTTSDLSHTFYVSSTAIAEYSPVLMVNVPDNSRTVACPHSDGMTGPICKTHCLVHCIVCV